MLSKIDYGLRIVKAKLLKEKKPISISFCITSKCNLKCSYCKYPEMTKDDMTTEQIILMIDEFYDMGMRKIGLSGGEPLLRKDLGEILSHCKKKKILVSITTNGVFIDKKIDELKSVDLVLVSIDGDQETQDVTKGSDVSQLLNSVRLLRKNKIKVWSSTVLTKQNLKTIDYLFQMAKKYDFKILLQPVESNLSWAKEMPKDQIPSKEEIKKIVKHSLSKNRKYIANSESYLNYILGDANTIDHKNCLSGERSCLIDSNGDIYPCFLAWEKMKPLNGLQIGFKEAFLKSPQYKCKGCTYPCHIEMHYLFNINLRSMLNAFRNMVLKR